MITEIEVDGIGFVRPLNSHQNARAKRGRGVEGVNRRLAFSIGLTLKEFNRLPAEKQREIGFAYNYLTSAINTADPRRQGPITVDDLIRRIKGSQRPAA